MNINAKEERKFKAYLRLDIYNTLGQGDIGAVRNSDDATTVSNTMDGN